MDFDKIRKIAEFSSFLALILGVPLGLIDLHSHAKEAEENAEKERVEAAERVYQTVDERYTEFVKLCIDHPRLDCYSVPRSDVRFELTEEEKVQQKVLYTELTDVFEVAYVQYHKEESNPEIRKIYKTQWEGWDAYIRKFMIRPAYLETLNEIKDEYDDGFAKYMDHVAVSQKLAANEPLK